ncbi:MAG: hypothetical protein ABFD94_09985 [Armatimonadia bacterium]
MALEVKHTTQATGTDAGNGEIGKAQWNETHTLTMATDKLLGRSTAGDGPTEEISLGAGLALAAGTLDISSVVATLTGVQTLTNKTFTGYTETVFALTGTTPALSASNGTVQTWALTGASSPTDGLSAGQSLTLMIDDGTGFSITWPSVTWKTNGGVAPTLNTTGFTAVVLWKVGSVLYGARVGDA